MVVGVGQSGAVVLPSILNQVSVGGGVSVGDGGGVGEIVGGGVSIPASSSSWSSRLKDESPVDGVEEPDAIEHGHDGVEEHDSEESRTDSPALSKCVVESRGA